MYRSFDFNVFFLYKILGIQKRVEKENVKSHNPFVYALHNKLKDFKKLFMSFFTYCEINYLILV